MTTHESIDHGWVREHIATYLAGGLPEEERARFEAHVGGCGPCLEDLQEAQSTEMSLLKLLDGDRPSPGMEDRVIQSLRSAPGPRFSIPRPAYRLASAIAAVLLMGVVGFYFDSGSAGKETKALASNGRSRIVSSLKGAVVKEDTVAFAQRTNYYSREFLAPADEMARNKSDELLTRLKSGLSSVTGDRDKETRASDHNETALAFEESERSRPEYRAHKNPVGGEEFGGKKDLERKEALRSAGEPALADAATIQDNLYFKPGGAAEEYKSLGVGGGSGGASKAAPRPGGPRGDASPLALDMEKAKGQEPAGKTAPAQDPQAPQRKIIR
ncbi:MAG TPA: anti-sigma factor, partial [Planctomycetota bacterium]|nr:anti-sigma factor [Planctomycetota bacterium]